MFFLKSSNGLYKFNNPLELNDTSPGIIYSENIFIINFYCMHLFTRSGLLLLCILFVSVSNSQPPEKSFHLRNAYEISGWLYKVEKGIYKPQKAEQEKMLGSLIWYANLQDEVNPATRLSEKLIKYPKLGSLEKKLREGLISIDTFFKKSIFNDTSLLSHININTTRDKIKNYNKKYFDELDTLNSKEREYYTAHAKYLNGKLLLNAKKKKIDSSYYSKNGSGDIQEVDSSSFGGDTSRYNSLIAIRSKLLSDANAELTDLENKRIEALRKFETQQKSLIVLKTEIENFVTLNSNQLTQFLITLNGRNVIFDRSRNENIYSNAYYHLNQDADFTFQSSLYLQEAQKYQGFRLPSQSDAIEAVAIYLTNRIKQESVLWFFETITRNAENYELIKTFFPTTIKLLQGNENYEVPNLGSQWRYSLSKDFMQMPRNVITGPWLKTIGLEIGKFDEYFKGAIDMAELIFKRYTYKDMIRTLYLSNQGNESSNKKNNPTLFSFKDLISLLYAINTELFIPDSSVKFRPLSYEDFKNLSLHELDIMISLIDLKYNGIFSKMLNNVSTEFKVLNADHADFIRNFLGNIEMMIIQVEALGTQFLSEQKRLQQNYDQNNVFFSAYNIWGTLNELLKIINSDDAATYLNDAVKSTKKVFEYVQQMFEVYNLLAKKNFSGAVLNTITLVENIVYEADTSHRYAIKLDSLPNKFSSSAILVKFNEITKLLKVAIDSTKEDVIKALIKECDSFQAKWGFKYDSIKRTISFTQKSLLAANLFEKDRHALQLVRKLSGFLNDVAMAKDDKQLAKVVESYAMPVGSYKRKRNNWASLDINAFAGGYIGYENAIPQPNDLTGNPAIKNVKTGGVWGLSVPIGISYSTVLRKSISSADVSNEMILNPDRIRFSTNGRRSQFRKKSTLTFSASIIDLGAIVSYRLFNSSDKPLGQDLKWSQFISPGFHMSLAIKSTPLVWNWGVQYTPQLRKFEANGVANDKQYNATRIYTGIFFDLPLFNLWERKHFKSYK